MTGRPASVTPGGFRPALEQTLMLLGCVAVVAYGALVSHSSLYQAQAGRAFDRSILERGTSPELPGVPQSTPAVAPSTTAPGSAIARLQIPSLALSAMVLEGTDELTLLLGVGHIDGTARPGETGNVGLAGHRDTFFRGLSRITRGSDIVLTTLDGRDLRYSVEAIDIVEPEAAEVLAPTPTPSLTLVTCYPFQHIGPAPRRFVVKAALQVERGSP